ncbi:MAG TPA: sialidase family protein [Terriglobales bacterium]|nr:sialidase family protein [Terriglobales bacterium]
MTFVRSAFSKVVVMVALSALAWAAPGQFSVQKRIALTAGDQWEPALSADGAGHLFVLYPHYGAVPDCKEPDCVAPTMLLVVSNDNGKTWQAPRVMLESGSGQFDPQIVVDPVDRRTVYAAWLQNKKRVVILAKSVDGGANWSLGVAVRGQVELDKPALAVRGPRVVLGFNHEEEVWIATSQDAGRTFTNARVNNDARPGWSLLGGATIDPAGNAYLAWTSYSKAAGARDHVDLFVSKSPEAGKATWTATRLDVSAAAPGCHYEDCGEAYLGAQVSITSDAGGTLYALWSSGSKRLGPQRLYFSSSTNGGDSWLPRASVSQAASGVEHAFPAIVAGATGDVRIAWMDTRNANDNDPLAARQWNTYYRSSNNGGATWSPESRLSNYVPGYRYIGKKGFRFPFGDYFGLAIDNHDGTHVVWGEGMNYQSPGSIWYAAGR